MPVAVFVWAVASLARGQRHLAPAPRGGRIPLVDGNDGARALASVTGGCAFGMVAALGATRTMVAGLIDPVRPRCNGVTTRYFRSDVFGCFKQLASYDIMSCVRTRCL
jgi:hypothetical protein